MNCVSCLFSFENAAPKLNLTLHMRYCQIMVINGQIPYPPLIVRLLYLQLIRFKPVFKYGRKYRCKYEHKYRAKTNTNTDTNDKCN